MAFRDGDGQRRMRKKVRQQKKKISGSRTCICVDCGLWTTIKGEKEGVSQASGRRG